MPNPIDYGEVHHSMQQTHRFQLPQLSSWHQKKFLHWANQVLSAQQHIQQQLSSSIVKYTLGDEPIHQAMQHYPKGDRIDKLYGGQYFYHCHRENQDTAEHGHFHCYLRQSGIPKHIPRKTGLKWRADNSMTHLIAIGMDLFGQPIRLFTVNRWVSDETWFDAKHAPHLIKRFKLSLTNPSPWQIIDCWVQGMVHLFMPQIIWLLQARDHQMAAFQHEQGLDCYENKSIEEITSLSIDLPSQIQWILS